MKLLDYILLIVIAIGIIYYVFFPNVVVDEQTILIAGDTTEIVINQSKFDSLEYHFKTEIEKLKNTKIKTVYRIGKTDTLHDTTYIYYSTHFNLGDSILGTSGIVAFDFDEFIFDSVSYRYPEKINTITDTLKFTNMIIEPFYLDEWFYSSVALLLVLIASLGSG
jgi:competence protein ComGC